MLDFINKIPRHFLIIVITPIYTAALFTAIILSTSFNEGICRAFARPEDPDPKFHSLMGSFGCYHRPFMFENSSVLLNFPFHMFICLLIGAFLSRFSKEKSLKDFYLSHAVLTVPTTLLLSAVTLYGDSQRTQDLEALELLTVVFLIYLTPFLSAFWGTSLLNKFFRKAPST